MDDFLNWIENEAARGLSEGDTVAALTAIKWKIKDNPPHAKTIGTEPQSSADSAPQVSIMPMGLSDGRTDYYVQIKVGDRVVTPHVFREEYKAAYHVALYDWLLNGAGEEPDCIEFGPKEWPARVVPARAEPQAARELAQEDMMRASDATALLDYLPSFADIKPRTWDDLFDLLREHGGIGFARKWIERLSEIRTILDAKRTITRAEPQSLPLRGPDCACCEQRPRKDCTVPGCTMKDAGWALERSQAVCEDGQ
jgi:hypothetical protein